MINNFNLFKKSKTNYRLNKIEKYIQEKIRLTKVQFKDKKCIKVINAIDDISLDKKYLDKYKVILRNFILTNDFKYKFYEYNDSNIVYDQSLIYEDNFIKLNIRLFNKLTQDLTDIDFYDHKNIAKVIYDTQNRDLSDSSDIEDTKCL